MSLAQWLKAIILATWEAKIRRIMVRNWPGGGRKVGKAFWCLHLRLSKISRKAVDFINKYKVL
jgi:hypothetical protein